MADKITQFDSAGLNVWADPETFEVTRERIAEYAAATNDPIDAHRNGSCLAITLLSYGQPTRNWTNKHVGCQKGSI